MAGDTASVSRLSSVLAPDELASVAENVQQKLEGFIGTKETESDRLKAQLARERGNFEQCSAELEKQLISANTKIEKENQRCQELSSQNDKLDEKLKASEAKVKDIIDNREDNTAQTQHLTRVNKQLEAEKQDLLSVLSRKDLEVKRLNEEWQSMSEKLSTATTTKCELQVKYDEIQGQDVSVKYREKRLVQEKEMLTSQNEWLSTELNNKTSELLSVRKEKSNQILELQGKLNNKSDEAKHLEETVESMKKAQEDQNTRIEKLVKKIQEYNETIAKNEEQFQSEIQAQSKLANLYKASADEAEGKVKELITAVEELQKLLKQATEAQAELNTKVQDMERDQEQKETELNEKIGKMETELENANDLLAAARKKGLAPISEEELTALSPTAAAASKFLKSGMTLTQIYSEYTKASDELMLEKQENQRLNDYLDQILQEIEEKAPIMQKQREDYEKCLETNNLLCMRFDSVQLEYEQMRVSSDESDRRVHHYTRENQRLKQQCADLGQQVRVLLNEVQEARGGPIGERDNVSSSDISSSSHVISEHLVTFKSIEELQKQNEKLLASIRDLSEKHEQQEKENVETKTSALRQQLESALQDLDQMRTTRSRQTEMVESIVRQRDMYRVLLEQSGTAPPNLNATASTSPLLSPKQKTPVSSQKQKSPAGTPQPDNRLEETKMALATLQAEYDTYKKEKDENARMLNEQIEKLQKELSDFRVQNAKLASQLDFSGERFKTAQSNVEGYKKEIAAMRDKSQKVSSEIIQHQQTISSLTQDLSAAQERSTKAEVAAQNLRAERDLLKGVEVRLNQEKESLLREQRSQSLLLTNLQTIQNNLERSEFETKARLSNQLETMERELTVLRRRLEGDNDQHRTVLKSWEGKVQDLHRQLNNELDNHQKTRDELHKCKTDLQNMKQQCSGVEAKLVSSQIKLESAIREKNEAVSAQGKKTVVSSAGHEEEVRDLKVAIRRRDDQIKGLNDQINKAKQCTEQYKSISAAIEDSLKEQNDASQTFRVNMEQRLEEAVTAKESLETQVMDLEKERDELKNESLQLNRAAESQTGELRRTVSRLQDELKEAIERKAECEEMEAAARQDSQEQARIAKEAQDKFEREFLLHAADVKQLVTVKEQLSSHNTKLAEAEDKAKEAQDTLASSKSSWGEQLRIQKQEANQNKKRSQELDEQNKVLHEQIQSLSQRMITEQSKQQQAPDSEGVLPSEKSKSAEQLLEVIKFLRREKEIAESRFEVAQSETIRLTQKCDQIEKQLNEAKENLDGERARAQVLVQTSAQHQDLMKKVESLNVLSDSNRLQREEKERLQQQVHQMEAKINQLESDIMPLQEQNRELTAQKDALTAEKASLAYDVKRWKQRTDHLMQQYNRADPEEQKKLLAEKEANRKQISSLNEENLRHKANISQLNVQLSNARTEISKLNNSLTQAQSQLKMEQNRLREELNTVKAEITTKDKDIEEKGKTINQVKKIGRRYKSQFEEAKAKLDELEKQVATQKAAPPQPDPATVAKVTELEQKVQTLTEETENLKKSEVEMRTQLTEKEKRHDRFNTVLQGAKQKITQLTAERDRQQSEADELRGEVSAMEAIMGSKDTQITNQKKESDARIAALEKQLEEARSKQASQTEQQQQRQEQSEEMTQLKNKIQEQQKQIEELQKQLSQQNLQPIGADRPSTSREDPPPTANIKPTAVSKPSPHAGGPRATASIRPIAVTPTSTTSVAMATTPTATVMPQTSSVPSDQDVVEQAQSDAPILAIATPIPPIQAVPPTQQTPPMAVAEPRVEAESEQGGVDIVEELGQVQEQQATEVETTAAAPSTSQQQVSGSDSTPVAPVEPAPVAASKRPRDEASESDGSGEREEKRQRVTPQPPPTESVKEQESVQQAQETQSLQTDQASQDPQQQQESIAANPASQEPQQESVPASETEAETQADDQVEESQQHMSQEEDDIVIVLSEDDSGAGDRDDAEGEGDEEEQEEEGDEEEEEEEEYEQEQEGDFEDAEIYQAITEEYEEVEGDEDDEMADDVDQEDEDEDDEDGDDDDEEGEEEMEGEEEEGDSQAMEEEEDSDDVVVIDSDDDQTMETQPMESQQEEQPQHQQQAPAPEQQIRRVAPPQLRVDPPEQPQSQEAPLQVPMQRMGRTRERLSSLGRPPFSLSSGVVPFEDVGDHDCQVPSTPTLFVPPRTDGFAEAINSPLIQRQGQFQFSDADRSAGRGLAQLATQGDFGMEDTRINLLGGDEEGGRSVPTTPLQTQAPVTMLSASPSAPSPSDMSQSVPVTTTETLQASEGAGGSDEPDTLPSEVPQTKPAGSEQGESTDQESQLAQKTEAPTSEGGEGEGGTATTQDIPGSGEERPSTSAGAGGEDNAEAGGASETAKPKPKRIIWGDQSNQGDQQRPPQGRGMSGGPPRGGQFQRGAGQFSQRGGPPGGRGGRGRFIQRYHPRGRGARGGMNFARRGGQGF